MSEYDEQGNRVRIMALRKRGVRVWSPERVFVAADVPPGAIEPGTTLMNAVISGSETLIRSNSLIGTSGTAVLSNVKTGRSVELGAGTYAECVLFDGVRVRGYAEIRRGTVLEEESEVAHNVGLKNTFFGPCIVAGSCINFCDVLVTGGTSRLDHSEIGSGAIHFNFAPNRDKFASLLGSVTGLLLRSDRIFIGGNCGIVAPAVIDFGTVVPAGTTVRGAAGKEISELLARLPYEERNPARKLLSGARVIASLAALGEWYMQVRLRVDDTAEKALVLGAVQHVEDHAAFRRREFASYLSRLSTRSACIGRIADAVAVWLEQPARVSHTTSPPEQFVSGYRSSRSTKSHVDTLRELPGEDVAAATTWLEQLVRDHMMPVTFAV